MYIRFYRIRLLFIEKSILYTLFKHNGPTFTLLQTGWCLELEQAP